jgi:hypothetical protein
MINSALNLCLTYLPDYEHSSINKYISKMDFRHMKSVIVYVVTVLGK